MINNYGGPKSENTDTELEVVYSTRHRKRNFKIENKILH
jgi:hypothetical protein